MSFFEDYLQAETIAVGESRKHWQPELEMFSRLADLYQKLLAMTVITDRAREIPGQLLLAVESQLLGVGSQLLRRRVNDAQALNRRAIELSGMAYRLWTHPGLRKIYEKAYPDMMDIKHPKQWQPSPDYKREFSTNKLFDFPGDVSKHLKALYSVMSASAAHAGPGAVAPHVQRDRAYRLSFLCMDDVQIRRGWHSTLAAYWDMLRVFLAIMRDTGKPAGIRVFEEDLKIWHQELGPMIQERSYWWNDEEASSSLRQPKP